MSSSELREHVYALAAELGVGILPPWAAEVTCHESPCGASFELLGQPMIWVSEEPETAEAYLVALHELGHHACPVLPCCGGGYPEGSSSLVACEGCPDLLGITGETLAWQWAEAYSLVPITPRLRNFIERRLDSHRDHE